MLVTDAQPDVLAPLCRAWVGMLQRAEQSKKDFADVADQCTRFYAGSVGYMWDSDFFRKFVGGRAMSPRFKITVAKAFELVALFGPTLYWRNPARIVKPRKAVGIDWQSMADPNDPQSMMMMQYAAMEQQMTAASGNATSAMLNAYLNYTPSEQPGGGLANHSSSAITEALVKGRGCLWPRPYTPPGSNRILTGCFYDSVDRLYIDPDATSIYEAKWIAQEVFASTWQAEREFSLPPDSLLPYANYESGNRQGQVAQATDNTKLERQAGATADMIRYFRIWSKAGIGARLPGAPMLDKDLGRAIDGVVGDYAYICVSEKCPWPLNAPTSTLMVAGDGELAERMRWPIPYWLDDRWPVSLLDFYRKPNSPWAIAPMAPGLGELTFINVVMSQLMNAIWARTRTLVALRKGVEGNVEAALKGGDDLTILKMNTDDVESLERAIRFIDFPEMKMDIWKILDAAMVMFDKRVGLSELLYSMNVGGVASRSAEDIATKRQMASIRPEYMASKVEEWQSEAADMEKLCAGWFVRGNSLEGWFGRSEQMLWDQLVVGQNPEQMVREMKATVAANSTRKPDKTRDIENISQMMQYFGNTANSYFQMTGDPTPLNGIIRLWGNAVDQDVEAILMQPPPPPPANEQAQAAQQAQLEQEQAKNQMLLEHKQQMHQQNMQQKSEAHGQNMQHRAMQLMAQLSAPEPQRLSE